MAASLLVLGPACVLVLHRKHLAHAGIFWQPILPYLPFGNSDLKDVVAWWAMATQPLKGRWHDGGWNQQDSQGFPTDNHHLKVFRTVCLTVTAARRSTPRSGPPAHQGEGCAALARAASIRLGYSKFIAFWLTQAWWLRPFSTQL